MTAASLRGGARTSRLTYATAQHFGVQPFTHLRCDHCQARLHDSAGNPRWECVGKLKFVCTGGCRSRKADS